MINARESTPAQVSGTQTGEAGDSASDDDDDIPIAETYELINSAPWRYLCAVPVISPPPVLNRTATELAKAEEARELSRASAKGWELMSGLDGHCMYFMSGWWSYSFCYGKAVVQYHALPGGRANEPPPRDANSQEYVLGRAQHKPREPQDSAGHPEQDDQTTSLAPPNAHLQIKGDQRYLSQRLEGGTVCDLTGRPRTIEIQYHCSPGTTADRIGWVKEVTTCAYLMVVYTPRLCSDVAFQPPKATRAHPIRCRQIISTEEEELAWRYNKLIATGEALGQKKPSAKGAAAAAKEATADKTLPQNYFAGTTIGGVVVGAKTRVGDEHADKLPLPRGVSRHQQQLQQKQQQQQALVGQVLASKKRDAARTEALSDEELQSMDLDPKTVREFREEMERLAGDRGWKLQLVEVPGEGVEYIGAFDDEEEEGEGVTAGGNGAGEGKKMDQTSRKKGKGGKGTLKGQQKGAGQKAGGRKEKVAPQEGDEEQEGSEEVFFKEEL